MSQEAGSWRVWRTVLAYAPPDAVSRLTRVLRVSAPIV